MSNDDTRQARIEAAAATWWQIAYVDEGDTETAFTDLPREQKAHHYRLMDRVLAAADAAAAPDVDPDMTIAFNAPVAGIAVEVNPAIPEGYIAVVETRPDGSKQMIGVRLPNGSMVRLNEPEPGTHDAGVQDD